MRSLVVPGIGLTMAISLPIRALIKVLFPTLGLPTIEILAPSLADCNCLEDSNTLLNSLSTILIYYLACERSPEPT